jgi:hypothetical protein
MFSIIPIFWRNEPEIGFDHTAWSGRQFQFVRKRTLILAKDLQPRDIGPGSAASRNKKLLNIKPEPTVALIGSSGTRNFFEHKNSLRRETVDLSRFPEAGDYRATVKMN